MERPVDDVTKGATAKSWLRLAVSGGVPKRSLVAALVVGTVLNLINQGDELLSNASLDYLELGLTYVVPYLVATYGSVTAQLQFQRASRHPTEDD